MYVNAVRGTRDEVPKLAAGHRTHRSCPSHLQRADRTPGYDDLTCEFGSSPIGPDGAVGDHNPSHLSRGLNAQRLLINTYALVALKLHVSPLLMYKFALYEPAW